MGFNGKHFSTKGSSVPVLSIQNPTYTNQILTYGANVDWDMNGGTVASLTLTGNATINAPTNMRPGATYVLRIIQDGSGNRTVTWNGAYKWPAAVAPVLSTSGNSVDLFTFFSPDGTTLIGSYLRGIA